MAMSFHFSYRFRISRGVAESCLSTRRCSSMHHMPYCAYIIYGMSKPLVVLQHNASNQRRVFASVLDAIVRLSQLEIANEGRRVMTAGGNARDEAEGRRMTQNP